MSVVSEGEVVAGVTYWSRDLGPYVWHRFDSDRLEHDLRAIADSGLHVVRTLLPWDVFMPTLTRPAPNALRNLEKLLVMAAASSVRVIPVLFGQAVGDCVFLPSYAIDVDAPGAHVRVVTDGVVQPGGPRDQYTDTRMLEAELRWLEGVMNEFAGNPAVSMWDLGHDPATVMRPRRIDHLRAWAALLAGTVHDAGERCALTLGLADITTARGVRLEAVAGSVDALGLAVDAESLSFAVPAASAGAVTFVAQLAQRLAGHGVAFHEHVAVAHAPQSDGAPGEPDLRRFAGDSVERLASVGCSGIHAAAWSDSSERVDDLAPLDLHPALARRGLLGAGGTRTAFGAGWLRAIGTVGTTRAPQPWPVSIDAADYYANLPHSIDDLYASWQRLADD